MTVLPKTGSDWERLITLVGILLASGIAWGSLKADVTNEQREIDAKADAAVMSQQYQSIMAAIQDIQNRLTKEHR